LLDLFHPLRLHVVLNKTISNLELLWHLVSCP
jgi:hypothetical protein